jgi:gas vesicle structural protein
MARKRSKPSSAGDDWLFPRVATQSELKEASLLDVLDNVLNHGVVVQGDLILGVANVDLIYVRLSALLAALDKIAKASPPLARSRRLDAAPGIDHANGHRHDEQKSKSSRARPRRPPARTRRRGSRNAGR